MTPIDFFAPGIAQTKGSARGFVVKGRAVITNDNAKAKPWAAVVTLAAREAMAGADPADCPLCVRLVFTMPRPRSHYGKRGLKPTAPVYCAVKPDVDKLARCALDAMTGVVFVDDSRIARLSATKQYGEQPGVCVFVQEAKP